MPAAYYWTNGAYYGSGWSWIPQNWQVNGAPATAPPGPNDDLYFDGSVSNANCYALRGLDLPEDQADFASLNLVNGYTGAVRVAGDTTAGLAVGAFVLESGAIDQYYPDTELSVLDAFTWTGGNLNTGGLLSVVNINGTGNIAPANGGTVETGSTLNFGTQGISTTVIVEPGTIRFNNGAGAVAGGAGVILFNTALADVNFENEEAISTADKTMTLVPGTAVTVTGPGSWNGRNLRLEITGGTLEVKGNATVRFGYQGVPITGVDILQTGGTIRLHSGSTLKTRVYGTQMSGGELVIVGDSPVGQTAPATLDTNRFDLAGGTISFTGDKWTFQVTGDVSWTDGEFKPRVDVAGTGSADIWWVRGKLTIPANKTVKVAPVPENYVAGNPLPLVRILIADKGVVENGTVTVQSQNPTFQLYRSGTAPEVIWSLGPP